MDPEVPERMLHSFYMVDLIPAATGAVLDFFSTGPGIYNNAHLAGISATISKRRQTGAASSQFMTVQLQFNNSTGTNVTVQYKVYRIAGLK
jgi:hypothetical protein